MKKFHYRAKKSFNLTGLFLVNKMQDQIPTLTRMQTHILQHCIPNTDEGTQALIAVLP